MVVKVCYFSICMFPGYTNGNSQQNNWEKDSKKNTRELYF